MHYFGSVVISVQLWLPTHHPWTQCCFSQWELEATSLLLELGLLLWLTLTVECGKSESKPGSGLALSPGSFSFCSLGNHSPFWKEVWPRQSNGECSHADTVRSHVKEHWGTPVKTPDECNLLGEPRLHHIQQKTTSWAQTTLWEAEMSCP